MKKTRIILNPEADTGRGAAQQQLIADVASRYVEAEIVLSERKGHARQLAQDAAGADYDLIVAAGGDGTIHEVVNGMMSVPGCRANLGVIPVGSGNDFAFALGLTPDVEAAVVRLFTGAVRRIDVARVEDENGRFVIMDNNFGIGFDAMVVVQTERIRKIHGFLKYFAAVLKSIVFYYHTPRLHIRYDNEEIEQKTLMLYVGNGVRGGGGFLLTPEARQDDGLLDICQVDPIGRLAMMEVLSHAMKGTHVSKSYVHMRLSREITIRLHEPAPIHVDGEIFAYPEDVLQQITITCLPGALRVVV
jgi:YegS/Rv2252/BmrU family lipid kinase